MNVETKKALILTLLEQGTNNFYSIYQTLHEEHAIPITGAETAVTLTFLNTSGYISIQSSPSNHRIFQIEEPGRLFLQNYRFELHKILKGFPSLAKEESFIESSN